MSIQTTIVLPQSQSQSGYSVVEWMIAIVLILFLTSGLFSIFISSRLATTDSLMSSERQESSTFAMQLLVRDLKHAYFFAQATGENASLWTDSTIPVIATSNDCIDDSAFGTFPTGTDLYRPLWAASVPLVLTDVEMKCLDDGNENTSLIANSDYISIKRARGLAQTDQFDADRYYLNISASKIDVHLGDAAALNGEVVAGVTLEATVEAAWEYIHHVYYLDIEQDIPRLRRITLAKNKMQLQEVIAEGIEDMQFMFALDSFLASDRTGSIHAFVAPSEITSNDWNTGRVIGMKVFLLARSLNKTNELVNNDSYQLGDRLFIAPGDAYKRSLSTQVITFPNSVVTLHE